jgi:4a-hydroxytetrahydrobiopterin dehydratase
MSRQGWQEFLAADDVADWVVLHGGAMAVYRVSSLVEAVRLAEAVAHIPGLDGAGALLTIADDQLTVRLTRDMWQLEQRHVHLARAVSAAARAHGAVVDRSRAQEVQLAIAAQPDTVDVGFWRAVLGYAGVADDKAGVPDDNAVDPLGRGSTVWMQDLDPAKPLRHAMHVDVSVAREQVEERLAAALAAGGRIVRESSEGWTLADRAGNRVCICAWPDGHSRPAATGPESSRPEEDRPT